MSVTLSDPTRRYPLRPKVQEAWKELGIGMIPDCNSGNLLGLGEIVGNWHNGKRQAAHELLDLSNVKIRCNTTVYRVLIEESTGSKRAYAVELLDGTSIIDERSHSIDGHVSHPTDTHAFRY